MEILDYDKKKNTKNSDRALTYSILSLSLSALQIIITIIVRSQKWSLPDNDGFALVLLAILILTFLGLINSVSAIWKREKGHKKYIAFVFSLSLLFLMIVFSV